MEAAQIVSQKILCSFHKMSEENNRNRKTNTNTTGPSPRSQKEAKDTKDGVFKFSNMDSSGYCVLLTVQ